MNLVLKIFLSMSFSGALLILALLWGKRFFKNKASRQWQYYIWLVVILRLLLPFGPETSFMGKTCQAIEQTITQAAPSFEMQNPFHTRENVLNPTVSLTPESGNSSSPAEESATAHPFQDILSLLFHQAWLIWLVVALGMLIRKITIYQSFIRYINVGLVPVSDIRILDKLSIIAEQECIKKPVELCINPLVSSPLLIGFFHPCIVLPGMDISEKDFQYIVLHELTHYKRRDIFYKWLVQVSVCLHWFNPLVHLMSREITNACELACDEAVLAKIGYNNAQNYGKTLLDAMAAVGKYPENPGVATLSENKQLLKERLDAIMNFKKKSKLTGLLMSALTLCVIFIAAFIGVYPVAAASGQILEDPQALKINEKTTLPVQEENNTRYETYSTQAEQFYEKGSLPLFASIFPKLDETTQKTWLEQFYADSDIPFFSVAVNGLNTSSSLFTYFAEKAYVDEERAFFSTLTDCMAEAELERWLDRALEDENWAFQSMLFDKLKVENEYYNELEKKHENAQKAEYQAIGVTIDGKNYYYHEQLVNIFLDIRLNNSYYTLNMNPAGTVNIKVIRDANDKITGVAYMTEAEVTELLKDMNDPDDKEM